MPGRQAFLVEMVTDRNDLANAIALNSTMVHAARLIGPAAAGLLIYYLRARAVLPARRRQLHRGDRSPCWRCGCGRAGRGQATRRAGRPARGRSLRLALVPIRVAAADDGGAEPGRRADYIGADADLRRGSTAADARQPDARLPDGRVRRRGAVRGDLPGVAAERAGARAGDRDLAGGASGWRWSGSRSRGTCGCRCCSSPRRAVDDRHLRRGQHGAADARRRGQARAGDELLLDGVPRNGARSAACWWARPPPAWAGAWPTRCSATSWTMRWCGCVCVAAAAAFAVGLPRLRKFVRPIYVQRRHHPRTPSPAASRPRRKQSPRRGSDPFGTCESGN